MPMERAASYWPWLTPWMPPRSVSDTVAEPLSPSVTTAAANIEILYPVICGVAKYAINSSTMSGMPRKRDV